MTVRSRAVTWVMTTLTISALSGCAAAGFGAEVPVTPSASAEQRPDRDPPPSPPPRYAPAVPEPKDARGIAACDLLTVEQLKQLGLIPDSARRTEGPGTVRCSWSSTVYDANPVGLELAVDTAVPVLDGTYAIRDALPYFEAREVAGHPAYRAELSETGTCTIVVAISDYQGVGAKADQPASDPCRTSTRMAEFVLSNLPPLTEE